VIVPDTVAPFPGAVIVTAGAVVSAVTVKVAPLLDAPPTVTITVPLIAPLGTGATMLVTFQLVGDAAVPLNLTVLVPCVAPKFAPLIVMAAPTTPEVGFRLVILGAADDTVKVTPLLATPPTVTTTLPVVAPLGTGAAMLVALQLVGVAAVPLNLTVLLPWVAPKFAPLMVTDAPSNPAVGLNPVILGALLVLLTITTTPALVAVLFDVSVAMALSVCDPLAVFVVSHEDT
jgi:hypothetical protein